MNKCTIAAARECRDREDTETEVDRHAAGEGDGVRLHV